MFICKLILLNLNECIFIHALYHAFTGEETVQNDIVVGIVATLTLVLIVGLVAIIVAVVVMRFRSKKQSKFSLWQISVTLCVMIFILCYFFGCVPSNIIEEYPLRDTEAAHTQEHVHPKAEENE